MSADAAQPVPWQHSLRNLDDDDALLFTPPIIPGIGSPGDALALSALFYEGGHEICMIVEFAFALMPPENVIVCDDPHLLGKDKPRFCSSLQVRKEWDMRPFLSRYENVPRCVIWRHQLIGNIDEREWLQLVNPPLSLPAPTSRTPSPSYGMRDSKPLARTYAAPGVFDPTRAWTANPITFTGLGRVPDVKVDVTFMEVMAMAENINALNHYLDRLSAAITQLRLDVPDLAAAVKFQSGSKGPVPTPADPAFETLGILRSLCWELVKHNRVFALDHVLRRYSWPPQVLEAAVKFAQKSLSDCEGVTSSACLSCVALNTPKSLEGIVANADLLLTSALRGSLAAVHSAIRITGGYSFRETTLDIAGLSEDPSSTTEQPLAHALLQAICLNPRHIEREAVSLLLDRFDLPLQYWTNAPSLPVGSRSFLAGGATPLHHVCAKRRFYTIMRLRRKYGDAAINSALHEARDRHGQSPATLAMQDAALGGDEADLRAVIAFVAGGSEAWLLDQFGEREELPAHAAARRGKIDALQFLLSRSCGRQMLERRNRDGQTVADVVWLCAAGGNERAFNVLAQIGSAKLSLLLQPANAAHVSRVAQRGDIAVLRFIIDQLEGGREFLRVEEAKPRVTGVLRATGATVPLTLADLVAHRAAKLNSLEHLIFAVEQLGFDRWSLGAREAQANVPTITHQLAGLGNVAIVKYIDKVAPGTMSLPQGVDGDTGFAPTPWDFVALSACQMQNTELARYVALKGGYTAWSVGTIKDCPSPLAAAVRSWGAKLKPIRRSIAAQKRVPTDADVEVPPILLLLSVDFKCPLVLRDGTSVLAQLFDTSARSSDPLDVRVLRALKLSLDCRFDTPDMSTALFHHALWVGDVDIVRFFLHESGATIDLHGRDPTGKTLDALLAEGADAPDERWATTPQGKSKTAVKACKELLDAARALQQRNRR